MTTTPKPSPFIGGGLNNKNKNKKDGRKKSPEFYSGTNTTKQPLRFNTRRKNVVPDG